MRVLVLATDGFGGHGGIALYVRNMLRALSSHRLDPKVVALPRLMPLSTEPLPENLHWDTSALGGKKRYAAAVVRASLKRGPFDAVLCTHINLLPLAHPVARVQRAPVVLFVYGIDANKPLRRSLAHRLIPRVDGIVSIRTRTTRELKAWVQIDHIPTYLLENAIDLSRYGVGQKDPELVSRLGLAGKRVVMTLSRLAEPYVGVDEVMVALTQLPPTARDVVYLIVGEGRDVPRLRERARLLGLMDRVVFSGFVPDAGKADYYRLADAFAMPGSGSAFDRYPLRFVFLEAMACGVPVIGARCEDDEERLTDGALLTEQVDPTDSRAIAEAIVRTVDKPKVVPVGLERFSYAAFEKRFHGIFDDILATRMLRYRSTTPPKRFENSDG
jgi:phosphatidylinositol alpha-1,6-mannosyltransferase